MVKIIAKNMPKPALLALFSFIVVLLLMNSAYAARQALEFSDVDVKVGSRTSKNLRDGQTINDEAEPGDNVEFRIEVRNNYTSAEDLEINDISVDVTIEGIDDGDDLDDEIASDFDLRAGRDKKVTIKFQVPLEVEEDEFDVIIRAEGDDENNTNQEAEMRLRLEVQKENHMIKITRNTLTPAELSCGRKNVQLGATVINIGNEDEEDVTLQVLNSDLDIDITQNIGELTAEPNEDESRFSNSYSLSIPNDAEAGSYPVTLRVLYDDGRKKSEETATLTVSDCAEQRQETADTEEEDGESDEVVSVTGKTTDDTEDTTAETEELPEGTVTSEESFFKSNVFVGGVIAAEVIAVVVGIVLVVSLFRRKG